MERSYDERIKEVNEGYLADFNLWDEDVARILAEKEGVTELNEEKMEIIRFMRDYYKKYSAFPILNYVCKNIHQPRECVKEARRVGAVRSRRWI